MVPKTLDRGIPGSFRDPDGFMFLRDGVPHRHVNSTYRDQYMTLMESGLYRHLAEKGALIPHAEAEPRDNAFKVLRPETIPFISFPYEWCFGQLRDAALLTLDIQREALAYGMSLKDASAYNVQFSRGRPIFIDTLSFESYREGGPWIAYRQFCQHFLAPLALMALTDARLGSLFRIYMDGVPLDLASSMLPLSSRFRPGLLMHIHLHAMGQKTLAERAAKPRHEGRRGPGLGKTGMLGIVDSLRRTVSGLPAGKRKTVWNGYYQDNSYSAAAFADKESIFSRELTALRPKTLWDLGANTGHFSRLAARQGIQVLSFDFDPESVDANYREIRAQNEAGVLPLVLDVTNPSPAIGWANRERASLLNRGPCDAVSALALIHHLAIANNVPLREIALLFRGMCRHLIIEFVPKEDPQLRRLLATRRDIFPDYHEEGFLGAFGGSFRVLGRHTVADSSRTIFVMESLPG